MTGPHDDDEILFVEREAMKARRNLIGGDDRDVHGAGFQIGKCVAPGLRRRALAMLRQQLADADFEVLALILGNPARSEDRRDGGNAVRRAERETAARRCRLKRLGHRNHASHPGKYLGNRCCQFHRAGRRDHAFRRPDEKRIVEHSP